MSALGRERARAGDRPRPGLTVEAALAGRRDAVHQAAMRDPHTGAELSMGEIRSLVDDLLEAHASSIPAFSPAGAPA